MTEIERALIVENKIGAIESTRAQFNRRIADDQFRSINCIVKRAADRYGAQVGTRMQVGSRALRPMCVD